MPYNGLSERSGERIYLNSLGSQRTAEHQFHLFAVRADQEGRNPAVPVLYALAMAPLISMCGCIDEAAELTISHLDYALIDRTTCVFSPEAFLDRRIQQSL